jgi:hypothetical protein
VFRLLQNLRLIKFTGTPGQLSPETEQKVLARAYVPEHIPGLMMAISQSRAFLVEDHLGFVKDNWLILVGYPLEGSFTVARSRQAIEAVIDTYHPEYLWFIGPEIPPLLLERSRARQSDQYFILDLATATLKSSLRRAVKKATQRLTVEQNRRFTPEHQALADEVRERHPLPPMIDALYGAMPRYLDHSPEALVLDARDETDRLAAFYVIEGAATTFDTYVLGAYSQKNYVPYASDLLFYEMIKLARERGKRSLNLGLGVNEGISRFKKKWGGIPVLNYEFCECYYGPSKTLSFMNMILDKNL